MAQPFVADVWFRDRLLTEQGLLSRVLVTAPASSAGTRLWHEERPEADRDLNRYGARLLAILETPLPLRTGTPTNCSPAGCRCRLPRASCGSGLPIMSSTPSRPKVSWNRSAALPISCPSMLPVSPRC